MHCFTLSAYPKDMVYIIDMVTVREMGDWAVVVSKKGTYLIFVIIGTPLHYLGL